MGWDAPQEWPSVHCKSRDWGPSSGCQFEGQGGSESGSKAPRSPELQGIRLNVGAQSFSLFDPSCAVSLATVCSGCRWMLLPLLDITWTAAATAVRFSCLAVHVFYPLGHLPPTGCSARCRPGGLTAAAGAICCLLPFALEGNQSGG